MRIGEIAAGSGVNIQALRYYERRGLLPHPRRDASGYRAYQPETIKLVRFIKRAQELGFTLTEISDLVHLRTSEGQRRTEVRALATAKLENIDLKIRHLSAMRQALQVLVEACDCEGREPVCPIIEVLNRA